MYATGDVVRLVDGELEWLRRNDSQVKFNGHRIELGEIEAVALAVEGVRAAVALIGKSTTGTSPAGETLRLYLESNDDEDLLRTRALQRLRLHLPAPMVPNVIQVLATLPLTPNGKVDRVTLMNR